ncbi:pyruvate dehydrogenase complex dihydrolipoamide acetyltransferase [Qipengyuania sp. JC766]|uniref:pyruvate dehydrogenase complex dihydrolipoamide acetyltransferase n=1 Tax=Qipengyuania sp. JC766 TaxID=3232139 RepID=UPI0034591E9A
MPTELKMPALSPTMEEGTLAKWLKQEGDSIEPGDIIAEIETDKATMEFEAIDEGTLAKIVVAEGSENVAVGTVIAILAEEGEDVSDVASADASGGSDTKSDGKADTSSASEKTSNDQPAPAPASSGDAKDKPSQETTKAPAAPVQDGKRIIASPLARRIADQKGLDLATIEGSGPRGRIVKADVEDAKPQAASAAKAEKDSAPAAQGSQASGQPDGGTPFEEEKLSNVRKVIAKRLTEAKQTVPHYYLSVDVRLDKLLDLRKQLNASLEPDGVKLSVNDMLIKALARALVREPQCNVSFQGETLHRFTRADVAVAVASPKGLITPIVTHADTKGLAQISTEMKDLVEKAGEGKLQPHQYQGGSASISNLGMFGIKQFDAVINPPHGMIMAVGAGEQRPYIVDGELGVATVMTASGSFDHRAIDGADGAKLMAAFKQLCEEPLGLVV